MFSFLELGSFRFEAVLKKNGDIYFIYKKVCLGMDL